MKRGTCEALVTVSPCGLREMRVWKKLFFYTTALDFQRPLFQRQKLAMER